MRTGRPRRNDYDREEFAKILRQRSRDLGITITGLGKRSLVLRPRDNRLVPINKGTINGIISGGRHATLEERTAIMRTLKFGSDVVLRFAGSSQENRSLEPELITSYNFPRLPLLAGVTLLVRGFYSEAYQEFKRIHDTSEKNGQSILQADAAARIAWLFSELGEFNKAKASALKSISVISKFLDANVREIIASATPFRPDGNKSRDAFRILSDALHLTVLVW